MKKRNTLKVCQKDSAWSQGTSDRDHEWGGSGAGC